MTATDGARCPLCAEAAAQPVLEKNGYTLARCEACHCVHVRPMPAAEALRAHYQDPAYFKGGADQGYCDYNAMHKALRPHFERRLAALARHLPARGRLLDFGCADGYFLELARRAGWEIAGVELSTAVAQAAQARLGVPIHGTLEALTTEAFDAVTLWEVVEHLPEPVAFLSALRGRLRAGGVLMLSTPNTGHWQAQRAPDEWVSYRPPSHLVYFDARTLAHGLRQAGFAAVSVRGVMPLPPLPGWLARATQGLQQGLTTGQAGAWATSLLAWRAARLLGWAWQKVAHPGDDVFTTLEAVAVRPQ